MCIWTCMIWKWLVVSIVVATNISKVNLHNASKYEKEHFTFRDHVHGLLVIPLTCLLGFFYIFYTSGC